MYVLALDLGGTKLAAAIVDEHKNIVETARIPASETSSDVTDAFYNMYCRFSAKYDIRAIGIGMPGVIDAEHGIVLSAVAALPGSFPGQRIREKLTALTGIPVALDNDCRVTTMGELWKTGASYRHAVGIFLGTGLGGCIIANGKPLYGHGFGAGELGHTILHSGGRPCFCGQKGCAETYLSGTALWKGYNALSTDTIDSGYAFFEKYQAGDPLAARVMDAFVQDLATFLTTLSVTFDPEAVIIGGGVIDTADLWWDRMEQLYRDSVMQRLRGIHLRKASAGGNTALYGAAKIAFDALEAAE